MESNGHPELRDVSLISRNVCLWVASLAGLLLCPAVDGKLKSSSPAALGPLHALKKPQNKVLSSMWINTCNCVRFTEGSGGGVCVCVCTGQPRDTQTQDLRLAEEHQQKPT